MFSAMITLPNPNDLLQGMSLWANAWFAEFAWVAYLIIGIGLVAILIRFLINIFSTEGFVGQLWTRHQIKQSKSFEDFSEHYLTNEGRIRIFRK